MPRFYLLGPTASDEPPAAVNELTPGDRILVTFGEAEGEPVTEEWELLMQAGETVGQFRARAAQAVRAYRSSLGKGPELGRRTDVSDELNAEV